MKVYLNVFIVAALGATLSACGSDKAPTKPAAAAAPATTTAGNSTAQKAVVAVKDAAELEKQIANCKLENPIDLQGRDLSKDPMALVHVKFSRPTPMEGVDGVEMGDSKSVWLFPAKGVPAARIETYRKGHLIASSGVLFDEVELGLVSNQTQAYSNGAVQMTSTRTFVELTQQKGVKNTKATSSVVVQDGKIISIWISYPYRRQLSGPQKGSKGGQGLTTATFQDETIDACVESAR